MLKFFIVLATAGLMSVGMVNSVFAKEKKAEDYIVEASPYLYLSCEGFVSAFGKDDEKSEEIIELMVAVSFINRQIDAAKFLPEKSDEKAFGEFLDKALRAQCKDDIHSLMVANVDRAVANAFDTEGDKKAK